MRPDRKLGWLPASGLAAVTLATTMLAGCDLPAEEEQPQSAGICVDEITGNRIDDEKCGEPDEEGRATGGGGFFFLWISTSSTHTVPAHGQRVHQSMGTRTVPHGTPVVRGLPAAGGSMPTLSRGGFGAGARVSGGYGGKSGGG